MHIRLVTVLSLALASSVQELPAQEGVLTGDAAKGAEVFAEARKALGGDRLASVDALQIRGTFRRSAGNNQTEGDLELILQRPDKMKRVEDTSAPGGGPAIVATQILNGGEVWDENTGRGGGGFGGFGGRGGFGGGARPGGAPGAGQAGRGDPAVVGRGAVDPERLRQALVRQRQGDLQRLLAGFLLSAEAPVLWVGTAESPEGRADVLEIRPPDGTPFRVFLDETTHTPLMLTWSGAAAFGGRAGRGRAGGIQDAPGQAPPPQAVTFQMTFADYKTVGGVRFPHTVTRGVNGQTNEEWTVSSYRVNPSLRADTFTQK